MGLDISHRATSPSMSDIAEFIRLRNRRKEWTTTAGTFTVKNDSELKILKRERKSRLKCFLMTSGDIANPGDLVVVQQEDCLNVFCLGLKALH